MISQEDIRWISAVSDIGLGYTVSLISAGKWQNVVIYLTSIDIIFHDKIAVTVLSLLFSILDAAIFTVR